MKATRFFTAVLLAAAATLAGCGERPAPDTGRPSPTASLLGPSGLIPGLTTGLLRCSPLPAATTTQTIGPEGGTLVVGPHSLTVPEGALPEPVTITATAPSDTVNTVQFAPEGLTFARTATLRMSYANCGLLGLNVPRRIAFTDDELAILYYLVSIDHFLARTVTGRLEHFSHYAIAW
jgi:hypothetical protein